MNTRNTIKRRDFLKGAVGLSLLGGMGCEAASEKADGSARRRRPNVLWIMMDDGRADALGCYGKAWARTPHIDAIARRGVRFETAIVQNPVCVPSRTSMKTGHYVHECGVMAMGKPAAEKPGYLDEEQIARIKGRGTLLDAWKDVGINPVNVGKIHAYRKVWDSRGDTPALIDFFGRPREAKLQKTFEEFQRTNPHPTVNIKTHRWMIGGVAPIRPEQTQTWRLGDKGVATLRELAAGDRPFFLRVSFHAPHVPCRVPESYFIDPKKITLPVPTEAELKSKPRFEREALRVYAGGLDLNEQQIGTCRGTYYGMVSLVDAQVGRLVAVLKETGQLENTIIAINSDQGFQLGEHGLWKKRVFYDQNVCVPLVLSYPSGLPQNKVVEEPVEMIDFLPTLMELSDLPIPDTIRGRSLRPLIEGKVTRWREACFSEIDHGRSMYEELRKGTGRRVMVRTKEWKLIYFMDRRVAEKNGALYNLMQDPEEQENLYGKPEYKYITGYLEGLAEEWARQR